ncbi:hypothetical protein SRABI83_00035 [Arthrobacter sp. Bi83]|uniref:sugar ABC transporter substrate-binding protein n=1 Tax=Arthrobacter sp. Bi83 TaxID=2822353 RepID=UPI001D7A2D11|nr:sugar ABC transporter substrate-binding protein [Arthrobacter sp. Bi83]CAH0124808.1 hypothetical protein SRABI83_00035 [Arthrobacter sp. Bi83]
MRTTKSRIMLAAGSTAVLLALAGCAESASSQTSADTVAIDVGNNMKVNLKTNPNLKVAVFIPGVANAYGQAQELAAKETAKKLGMEMTLFDGGYNPSQQLNQMQTALVSGGYDAAVVQALDGTVVCKTLTEDYPKANILVVNNVTPLCDYGTNQTGKSVEEVWAPGTMNFVGSNNTRAYIDGWFSAAAKANPGKQNVVAVLGPAVAAQTRVVEVALAKFAKDNPGYTVNKIYTDYTTTGTFNETQTYLQGHADTTLILSMYTPDISQGVVKAVEDAGLLGKIHIVDQGFGEFSIEQIKAGNIQFSTLFFPYNGIKVSLEAIAAAQRGDAGPRFVDDSVIGTAKSPFTITKDTISELPPELR